MKRKLVFTGLVLLALVLATGTFAYTYTNGATSVSASSANEDYAAVTPAGAQPNFNLVLPIVYDQPQYLYPDAQGDLTGLTPSGTGANWEMVDDPYTSPDDAATYVYTTSTHTTTDLYAFTNVVSSTDPIQGIKLYYRVRGGNGGSGEAYGLIQIGTTGYYGQVETGISGSWTTYSYEWLLNPDTNLPWTEADVDALQAGIALTKYKGSGDVDCTQVYIEVEYQLVTISGDVPTGGLYQVTPASGFTGDLTVNLYLVNSGNLTKAYRYLNLAVALTDSVEASQSPGFKIISLNNGETSFHVVGGTASTYDLNVVGGGYKVTSDNVSNWQAGWDVFPQFYCEVSQR